MKKVLILFAIMLLPTMLFADGNEEYDSFLTKGKVWEMQYVKSVGPEYQDKAVVFEEYKLDGNTLTIDDIPFKKIYTRGREEWTGEPYPETWDASNNYLGEKDGKVYLYDNSYNQVILVMDFTLNNGDIYVQQTGNSMSSEEWVVTDVVEKILPESQDKRLRKIIYLQSTLHTSSTDVWIEGVGSITGGMKGGLIFFSGGAIPCLIKCSIGESTLFYNTEAAGLNQLNNTIPQSSSLYDLSGRRLTREPERGVYIKDGRKVVIK